MKHLLLPLILLATFCGAVAAEADDRSASLEKEVTAIVAGSQVTVVHFWAPWCSNCASEMTPNGWAKFVNENPAVKVVFLNIWHEGQPGERKLATAGLGTQENFIARTHPNPSSTGNGKLDTFLGLALQWTPTTWVFRDGKLRYAINYGEVRFDMLQQMVKDAAASW
jgi:thiol-disulfide isomerase/thioredoxin